LNIKLRGFLVRVVRLALTCVFLNLILPCWFINEFVILYVWSTSGKWLLKIIRFYRLTCVSITSKITSRQVVQEKLVDFYDTFWSFFSGLGSNLNGVGKIGCLEVATMVIRAMILGSAACSNKYLCFDRSINLGTIPVHKVSECSLHW